MFHQGPIDAGMHAATVLLSALLLLVSYRSYRESSNPRFFYVMLAFGIFSFKETMILANVAVIQSSVVTWFTHVLNLLILLVFFRGTVR
ncbi:MAG: hypothetical protein ABEK01_01440 [Candidatus Nanohaloarchaea archaeon]